MKIETSKLEGAALDWAVAKATGYEDHVYTDGAGELRHGVLAYRWAPSTNWTQGGPLIESKRIAIVNATDRTPWLAMGMATKWMDGPTPLIAAMRAIVASELGDTVDVPEELLS